MKANTFPVMGFTRSFWDFHMGMGLAASVSLTAEAILFWQLASLAKTHALILRPILITFTVAYFALSMVTWTYIFPPPSITEILIALCLIGAIVTAKSAVPVAIASH